MNEETKSDKNSKDPRITNHELHAYRLIIWIGVLVRYLVNFGSHPFNQFYKPESDKLNFFIGFILQLLVIIAAVGFLFYYSSI